jgi:light-regulated signal transduction histidine kinase (bacteriophytochrome)
VARLFPNDVQLARANIESYFVTPVIASNGETIGVLVLLGEEALQVGAASASIIDIFANRISVELERKAALEKIGELNTSLERRVAQRTAALSQSNDELEAFSYSVSHDLRAPLTAIQGFAALLLRHYTSVLDNSGQHYLQRIVEGSRRMGELIDGLLTLAHITRQPLQRRDVDLAALSSDSLRQLREGDPLRKVHFECTHSLNVTGDPRLLQALVHNLMDNAWKYTSRTSAARIEVGSLRIGNDVAYFVRDNGVGFDGAQSDRLFQPFRRLHDPKQFRGTGIGLATVARIVRRHGGRIWAEGRPDQGATFYFTLPEASRQTAGSEPTLDTTRL